MKTIVLIDLLAGGHRDAFMRYFAKSCVELGVQVVCIYPEPERIRSWMDAHYPAFSGKIIYIHFHTPPAAHARFGRFNDALNALHYWRKTAAIIRKTAEEKQLKIDLVFFNCIDILMGNYLPAVILDRIFTYRWSSLFLHPVPFRRNPEYLSSGASFRDIDSIFLSKNCIAVTLHDEGLTHAYQQRLGKPVILLPEIADDTPVDPMHPVAQEIREKANGRIVTGMIGLEPYKGTYRLMQLAKLADPSKYYFVFLGNWGGDAWKLYFNNDAHAEEFFAFIRALPENCYWRTGPLREGSEYNSVFSAFDVVWLMYKDFYSSSNRLTKASLFHRLVLASDLGCVGEDVPKYGLGETANQDDSKAHLQKLEHLRERILQQDLPYTQWKQYAAKHSLEALNEKFAELLNLVP